MVIESSTKQEEKVQGDKEMLKVIMTDNGISLMGMQSESDHARLIKVRDPLLFLYNLVPGSDIDFSPIDMLAKPRDIRFRFVMMYDANEEQARQYNAACAKIFKSGDIHE